MKFRFTLLFFIFLANLCKAQYPSHNMTLLGHWDPDAAQKRDSMGTQYSSVYGYYDTAKHKEYAIVGGAEGTFFIEVTDPYNPVVRDFIPGRRDSCIWREYKTYDKYVYMVSDDYAPNSFQIADLSYLPDSVHVIYDDTALFERAHTIFVDKDKLYCGITTKGMYFHTMSVYSLANPESPSLIRQLDEDYPYPQIEPIHDMYSRNDTVYASAGYQGLFILKLKPDSTFSILAFLGTYPGQGYNHSSSLTPDGRTLVFTNEVPAGLPVQVLDVSDLNDLTITSTFESHTGATAHNPYIFGGHKALISYYQDGVQLYDISDPYHPVRTAYFDTRPEAGDNTEYATPTYQGCWGAYPYLPSGNLLAMDMQNGLFILKEATDTAVKSDAVIIYPNPVKDKTTVHFELLNTENYTIKVFTVDGKIILDEVKQIVAGKFDLLLDLSTIASGNYILKIEGVGMSLEQKLTKLN